MVSEKPEKLFVLPNLNCICLINFICYRIIKISWESTLVKASGRMEWNYVNPILCSVSYLPFLLRLNITQRWPLLVPSQFILAQIFKFLPNLHLHLVGLRLSAVTVDCSFSASWNASMGPEVAVSTYAFRNTCARSSASATSPPLVSPEWVHATSSWVQKAIIDRMLWPFLNSVYAKHPS